MLLKYTLRNIFTKKGRLVILMLCIIVACFTANLAIELSGALKGMVSQMIRGMYGNTNFAVACLSNLETVDEHTFDDCPVAINYVIPSGLDKREITRSEHYYNYALSETVSVNAFNDPKAAEQMGLFRGVTIPADGSIAIGSRYAERCNYKVGDTITLYDRDEKEVPLTVESIFKEITFLGGKDDGLYAVISQSQYEAIAGSEPANRCLVQVIHNRDKKAFQEYMEQNHRGLLLQSLEAPESLEKMLDNVVSVLYLLFALVFILVIFVTVSFTEKIIVERMTVIGTLRSIGMSIYKTTAILLFENIMYGLTGGIIAMIGYLVLRTVVLRLVPELEMMMGPPNILKLVLIVLGAVFIEVLVPLKEVLKAVKTSIRDIIFESRDSEYRINYPSTILGFVLVAVGIVLGLFTKMLIPAIASLLLIVIGGGLAVRFIVRKITWWFAGIFAKKGMPVAELAAKECGSKKPNSGNAILAVSTICAATAVVIGGITFASGLGKPTYDTDVVVEYCAQKEKKYQYINELEGVEKTEFIYYTDEAISYGGKSIMTEVFKMPEGDDIIPFHGADKNIAADEIILDEIAAHQSGAKVGDTITVTFHSDGIIPVQKTLRVKQILPCDSLSFMAKVIIAPDLYSSLFSKKVSMIMIKSSNPEATKKAISDTMTMGEKVQTVQDLATAEKGDIIGITIGLIASIVTSVALTLIGISGNQVIGFISRKKEYAMLHSCACDQASIIRMIWIENGMLFGISVLFAGILSIPLVKILSRIFEISELGIYATPHYGLILICLVVLWGITMLTARSPIKGLKKMNTAAELKYE